MKIKKIRLTDRLIIVLFFCWRLGLFLIEVLATRFLIFKGSFPYFEDILPKFGSRLLWQWANFDGVHYLMLAQHGYKSIFSGITQAFFPLFPLLIRHFDSLINNYLYTGLILSNLSFLLALLVFKRFLLKIGVRPLYPVLFLLLFPTSFYFGAVYTESLFLLLSFSGLLFLEKKNFFLAALFFGLSSAARVAGIFLIIPFLMAYFKAYPEKDIRNIKSKVKFLVYGLVCVSGFLFYSAYLWKEFSDPFYFASVQSSFGASRQTDKIILLHQVVWRYLKMLATVNIKSLLYFTVVQEFAFSILALALIAWGYFKTSLEKSYLHYSFLTFILPTLTGNFSSMPRYVLTLFPIFIILAKIKSKKLKIGILFFSSLLLIINTALFLRGYWVA
jgi:Gpi18-like mannosyltransferase